MRERSDARFLPPGPAAALGGSAAWRHVRVRSCLGRPGLTRPIWPVVIRPDGELDGEPFGLRRSTSLKSFALWLHIRRTPWIQPTPHEFGGFGRSDRRPS
uniref:Uncharacterized protein n=1 Tax=Oryza sativa subsp. japonica TaxID=39947 RepID=Q6YU41_ORYSJ|nr:hypothetical protein [Oryza sativa Japonica Group]BAD31619.1 hypothetical protein [Oryza sativa Japonica Group]